MPPQPKPAPLVVVALGGNALLPRGGAATAENQQRAVCLAARQLAPLSLKYRLLITHGSGPQVGLMAMKEQAYGHDVFPLDLLDAQAAGEIGHVIELELDNAIDAQQTVTVLTRVVVDADDPAFDSPTKFIGPAYAHHQAVELADRFGWKIKESSIGWRRVVASPEPRKIVQTEAISELIDSGFLVVCLGGGGVPVTESNGIQRGVEAVIDKDLATSLLAASLPAEVLVLATDVEAIYQNWGTEQQRAITSTTPEWLLRHRFEQGSMAPKVEAACRFVEATGGRAAIGQIGQIAGLLDGSLGTQVHAPELAE